MAKKEKIEFTVRSISIRDPSVSISEPSKVEAVQSWLISSLNYQEGEEALDSLGPSEVARHQVVDDLPVKDSDDEKEFYDPENEALSDDDFMSAKAETLSQSSSLRSSGRQRSYRSIPQRRNTVESIGSPVPSFVTADNESVVSWATSQGKVPLTLKQLEPLKTEEDRGSKLASVDKVKWTDKIFKRNRISEEKEREQLVKNEKNKRSEIEIQEEIPPQQSDPKDQNEELKQQMVEKKANGKLLPKKSEAPPKPQVMVISSDSVLNNSSSSESKGGERSPRSLKSRSILAMLLPCTCGSTYD